MSPLDLNIEHGQIEQPEKPIVRVATPVFDAAGQKRGIVVLNYLGTRVIGEVRAVAANAPGTTMLLSGSGEWLLGPNQEEGWGVVPESDRTFARNYAQDSSEPRRGYSLSKRCIAHRQSSIMTSTCPPTLAPMTAAVRWSNASRPSFITCRAMRSTRCRKERCTSSW